MKAVHRLHIHQPAESSRKESHKKPTRHFGWIAGSDPGKIHIPNLTTLRLGPLKKQEWTLRELYQYQPKKQLETANNIKYSLPHPDRAPGKNLKKSFKRCRMYWQYSKITRFNSASACVHDNQSGFLNRWHWTTIATWQQQDASQCPWCHALTWDVF